VGIWPSFLGWCVSSLSAFAASEPRTDDDDPSQIAAKSLTREPWDLAYETSRRAWEVWKAGPPNSGDDDGSSGSGSNNKRPGSGSGGSLGGGGAGGTSGGK
jgi:uncharacterized membrane protein YgcG